MISLLLADHFDEVTHLVDLAAHARRVGPHDLLADAAEPEAEERLLLVDRGADARAYLPDADRSRLPGGSGRRRGGGRRRGTRGLRLRRRGGSGLGLRLLRRLAGRNRAGDLGQEGVDVDGLRLLELFGLG